MENPDMEEDLKKMLVTMIDMSISADFEMVNMGEWSMQQLQNAVGKKMEYVEGLKNSSIEIKDLPPEILYKAVHDFSLYLRVLGPSDGMETMRKVEQILSKHIQRGKL
jgi:hypothetical protein